MTTLKLVEKKAEKRIGMTAYTKSVWAFHGKSGKTIDYCITKTEDDKFISHEKNTVLFMGSKN